MAVVGNVYNDGTVNKIINSSILPLFYLNV